MFVYVIVTSERALRSVWVDVCLFIITHLFYLIAAGGAGLRCDADGGAPGAAEGRARTARGKALSAVGPPARTRARW